MDLTFRLQLGTAVVAGLALGGVLLATCPAGRASVRNALVLLLACAGVELLAGSPLASGHPRIARAALDFASFGAGVALIRLGLLGLYRLLAAARISVVNLVEDLVTAAVLLLWIFVWLRLAGVDLASLVATSAVITAVIAFAMQDTLGNILGGIVLQLDDSMRVGDWVQVDDIRGRVTDVRWRYTAIETRNRETVFVPNSALMKNRFTVIGSRNDPKVRWRRWVWFAVELGAPPSRVRDALERAVTDADIPFVSRDPKPDAVLMDVTDGCARYALRYWLGDPHEDDTTDSQVRAHALAALARAGIHVASRREERLVLAEDEAHRAALADAEAARRMNALQSVPLFDSLSHDEQAQVARHLVHAPFLKGDVVTRQGAVAHWLYLVIDGTAEICDETGGTRRHVNSLGPGDIFGERGMLTGEPRSSTVVATTDLDCYRLDKAGLAGVLRERPDIAEHMSRILAQRVAELDRLRTSAVGTHAASSARTDMLARIRAFFGLD